MSETIPLLPLHAFMA